MGFYNQKNVLVTGGTGLIGKPLVEMLLERGARVRVASMDDPSRADHRTDFRRVDLTRMDECLEVTKGMDYVFHLVGIKGSPKMTVERPASFFVPTLLFNTNMMEAARRQGVERYLFTSTIGVYTPAEVFREDDVWKGFPSENDRFAGWAKRMGELQAEAYKREYGWNKISIVRPANVYGCYDNFDINNGAMVVPSLIKRATEGENPLVVWGDGSPIRDVVHARDVSRGMLMVVEKEYTEPVNLGSGNGYSIKEIAEVVAKSVSPSPKIEWDISKPMGDKKRVMDISRANSLGFYPEISLDNGIREVVEWYSKNRRDLDKQYSVFRSK